MASTNNENGGQNNLEAQGGGNMDQATVNLQQGHEPPAVGPDGLEDTRNPGSTTVEVGNTKGPGDTGGPVQMSEGEGDPGAEGLRKEVLEGVDNLNFSQIVMENGD